MSPGVQSGRNDSPRADARSHVPSSHMPGRIAIAMVMGIYPALSHTFIDREVRALRAAGCRVVTVALRASDDGAIAGEFQRREAGRVHRLRASARNPLAVLRALGFIVVRPKRLFAMFRLAWAARPRGSAAHLGRHPIHVFAAVLLAEFLHRSRVQHVHNHLGDASGTVAMLAAELAGLPFSMTLHGPEVFSEAERWRLDVKITRSTATACISEDALAKALRLCPEEQRWKVVLVPCGVTPHEYGDCGRGDADRTGRRLMFIGRLVPRKECAVLLDALAQVLAMGRDATLEIIGAGPERTALERQVAAMGLGRSVRFMGPLDEKGVADALRGADILVVPSSSEGLPVVIMEAMASGLPVIASAIDGIPELVRDGTTGLLVPPRDPVRLAQAIARLIDDPHAARRMGAAGRTLVRARHDAGRNALTLLRRIMPGSGAHHGRQVGRDHLAGSNVGAG